MTERSLDSSLDPVEKYKLALSADDPFAVVGSALAALFGSSAISAGLYYMVLWLPWLSWPVIGLIGLWVLGVLGIIFSECRLYVTKSDTGTSTIRGASQGAVEIKGRVKAIAGQGLISPAMQIPCVHYKTAVASCGLKQVVVQAAFFEQTAARALLIDDGTDEAFVPRFANTLGEQLLQAFKTVDTLPAHLKDQVLSSSSQHHVDMPEGSYNLYESVLPVGLMVQANANLVTLKASDSYIRAWRNIDSNLDILLSATEQEQIEKDWRSYTDTAISKSREDGNPVPRLNALIPLQGAASFTLQYRPASRSLFATSLSWVLVLLSIAPVILAMVLLGWLAPQDLWAWR